MVSCLRKITQTQLKPSVILTCSPGLKWGKRQARHLSPGINNPKQSPYLLSRENPRQAINQFKNMCKKQADEKQTAGLSSANYATPA